MSTVTKNDVAPRKHYKNRSADSRQSELYKRFTADTFLGSEKNTDHFIQWVTFFRRNLHRFAMDYLGITLHMYQIIMLYLMGINNFIVVIASRASAKSFIIALYACCRCILYPNSLIVLSSATKGQSKLLVSEKIQNKDLYIVFICQTHDAASFYRIISLYNIRAINKFPQGF